MIPNAYLNPVKFTQLFRNRSENHAAICMGLYRIAKGVGARFWFRSRHDRDEVVSTSLLFAIERIDRFDSQDGNNAFAYYSRVIYFRIRRAVREMKSQGVASFTDINSGRSELNGGLYGDFVWDRRKASPLDYAIPYAQAS